MIQRIQSVLLFAVSLIMIAMLFFPLWEKTDQDVSEIATMDVFKLKYEQLTPSSQNRQLIWQKDVFYIAILAVITGIVALFSIFQFKNRLRQIQLGALNSFLISATIGLSLYFIIKTENMIAPEMQGSYLYGFYLPVIALFCNMMANRFIRKDEKLVRSADRIR